ncbi:hypothetical protein MXAN_6582 [Myxococcus xanthus DK 1622]|uniref:Uncharacterized protein n=1 Tax=Myxococcus xanthus (strain DK1622) TaxID=246197 RepID=Q1CY21_MYXXD|nr:hypothetical protein MXAN_6582 [Myxococcus xanthus DK 1622]
MDACNMDTRLRRRQFLEPRDVRFTVESHRVGCPPTPATRRLRSVRRPRVLASHARAGIRLDLRAIRKRQLQVILTEEQGLVVIGGEGARPTVRDTHPRDGVLHGAASAPGEQCQDEQVPERPVRRVRCKVSAVHRAATFHGKTIIATLSRGRTAQPSWSGSNPCALWKPMRGRPKTMSIASEPSTAKYFEKRQRREVSGPVRSAGTKRGPAVSSPPTRAKAVRPKRRKPAPAPTLQRHAPERSMGVSSQKPKTYCSSFTSVRVSTMLDGRPARNWKRKRSRGNSQPAPSSHPW